MPYGMTRFSVVVSLLVLALLMQHRGTAHAGPVIFSNGGYDGVVVSIADNVPAHDCRNIVDKLEVSLVPQNIFAWKQVIGANFKLYISIQIVSEYQSSYFLELIMKRQIKKLVFFSLIPFSRPKFRF